MSKKRKARGIDFGHSPSYDVDPKIERTTRHPCGHRFLHPSRQAAELEARMFRGIEDPRLYECNRHAEPGWHVADREACAGKRVYTSEPAARFAADERAKTHGRSFDVYHCDDHRGWHLATRR